tara:strand:- start:2233 stop:2646 length:414 start_codon:yes stop_codon:yes gene_type:complete
MNTFMRRAVVAGATVAMSAGMMLPHMVGAAPTAAEKEKELFQGLTGENVASNLGQSNQNLTVTVARLIRNFLGLLGILAVIIVVIGGFEWMTAGGNTEGVDNAKKRILQGVIGMAIVLSAFAIAQFVIGALTKSTTG